MNQTHKILGVLVMSFVLSACATSASHKLKEVERLYPEAVRVCDINENRSSYFGMKVIVEGIYSTDNMIYSYVTDDRCAGLDSILDVGTNIPRRDLSVDIFEKSIREKCDNPYLCPVQAHVIFRGTIVEQTLPGHLGFGKGQPFLEVESVLFSQLTERER